jgi:acyl-CoA synthetase (AMP-forming)/AMP-acid ligase II
LIEIRQANADRHYCKGARKAADCSVRLARYKVPKEFCIIDALPRKASAKVVKDRLNLGFLTK